MTVTDVDGTYTDDEERAQLIERTAMAIFKARVFGLRPLPEDVDLRELWNAELSTSRILFRNQARAALAGSELLKRIEELETRIQAARAECVIYGGELDGPTLARKVNRVDRILAKPVPDPEPIRLKP